MIKIITILLLAFSVSSVTGQQLKTLEIPNTPAGSQLRDWLSVFTTGDQDKFVRFIADRYSQSILDNDSAIDLADRQARKYLDARSYDILTIEISTDFIIVVLSKAALTGLWFRITMRVETEEPYKVIEYIAQRIPPPAGTQKKLDEKELINEVKKFMDKLVDADAFSGTLLIAKNNKTIFESAYGLAHKGYSVPNRTDTKLNIASIGKMFTSVAIAQLMEKGRLSFSDTVGKFLPDYPNKQVSGKVTIHHLLSHSSGMGDIHGREYVCRRALLRQVKDYFPLFENDSLLYEPGERWQYSNAGFILLGAIIEKVSGENFFDYIREHIFKPSRMINTDYFEADIDVPNIAVGYTNYIDLGDDYQQFHLGPRRNTSQYGTIRGNPQGGAYSTAEDLLRFSKALKEHILISSSTTLLMASNKIFARKYDAGDTYWGYGFELETANGKRVIGHGGGDLGISAALRMYPDSDDYTVVVLSNYDRGGIITIYKIQEMITEGE